MIKALIAGLWVGAVTLASAYAAISWQAPHAPAAESGGAHKTMSGLDTLKTRMISVPVISDGALHGYVMAQFVITADAKTLKHMTVKPDLFVLDEAFKTIYAEETIDFRNIRKHDLAGLAKRIAENINKRMGFQLVDDVLIQELNYLPKDSARGGLKQR